MSEKQLPEAPPANSPLQMGTPHWQRLGWLQCELSLELPVAQFTVRELLRLREGNIVSTQWSRGAEIPLRANDRVIGWAEFEPVGDHVGVRITELV